MVAKVQYTTRHSTPRSLSEKKEKKKWSLLFSISRLFLALSPVRFLALYRSCLFSRLSSDMCTHILYISSRLLLRVEMDQIIGKSKIERRKEVHEELARRTILLLPLPTYFTSEKKLEQRL